MGVTVTLSLMQTLALRTSALETLRILGDQAIEQPHLVPVPHQLDQFRQELTGHRLCHQMASSSLHPYQPTRLLTTEHMPR